MHSTIVKTHLFITVSLLTVLFAACAPNVASTPAAQPVVIQPSATLPPATPTLESPARPTTRPTQDLAPTPYPIATSRGPHLEATDPKTVTMASGNLQFVEFFEFW
jgi:hypothetical protein